MLRKVVRLDVVHDIIDELVDLAQVDSDSISDLQDIPGFVERAAEGWRDILLNDKDIVVEVDIA